MSRKSLIAVTKYISEMKGDDFTRDGLLQRLMFILNDSRLRQILCGQNSTQWHELIQEGKTFILDCHGMGNDKMIFMGTLVTQGLKAYFRSTRLDNYPPLALYIDEFHNFLNVFFFDLLKEGRKYGIAATLATQDLASLGKELRTVVLNCGTLITFRNGHYDANLMAYEMGQ